MYFDKIALQNYMASCNDSFNYVGEIIAKVMTRICYKINVCFKRVYHIMMNLELC